MVCSHNFHGGKSMATKTVLAAGLFSLILAGTWESVQADPRIDSQESSSVSTTNLESFRLLGYTLCFSQAPPDAECDWRLPSHETAEVDTGEPTMSFTILGRRYCIGESTGSQCDVTFPAKSTGTTRASTTFRLFGWTVCLGDISTKPQCDLRFPAPSSTG